MNEKKIKVLTSGMLNVPGFFYGPILTPYLEKLSVIYRLVSSGIEVVEVCNDGREVKLDRFNYADDHNVVNEVKKPDVRTEKDKKEQPVEVTDPVETEAVVESEEVLVEDEETIIVESSDEDADADVNTTEDPEVREPVFYSQNFNKNHNKNKKKK